MAPSDTFTITAAPGTDIWRKPPATDVFNAPTALPESSTTTATNLRTSGPLTSFLSARLSLNFTPKEQYDQGGLLLSFYRRNPPSNASDSPAPHQKPQKWIKAGVEHYNGAPRLSTVACDAWADWSVADLHPSPSSTNTAAATTTTTETGWTTLLVEKDQDGNGTGVWVYRVAEATGEKVPLREVCWVFGDAPEEWDVEVRAMAARPAKGAEGAWWWSLRGWR
ncbi:5f87df88-b457-4b34-be62-75b25470660a [Thermothielavioides terrestris]|uniref:5f87df88-b457-4b34-be62-75b25470660a n=1 Tax=Thermothielavioides terrestris TaxID=2587410 RepID=A0A446BCQ7_9PEZI|nr:5f87df88-b457-4b34-be62-75b25470660a [Thermothielavioides terrestris]